MYFISWLITDNISENNGFMYRQSPAVAILASCWSRSKLCLFPISAMLKVPDGTFSWKWFKSLAQRSDLNLVGSTWSPK